MPRDLLDRLLLASAIFLLVFSPLAYGGVEPWALKIVLSVVGFMVAIWLFRVLGGLHELGVGFRSALPFVLFLLLVLIQLTPLPAHWRSLVEFSRPAQASSGPTSPQTNPAATEQDWDSISLNSELTSASLIGLLAFVGFCLVVVQTFRRSFQIRSLLIVIVLLGLGEATYGLYEYWSGRQQIFWYHKVFYTEDVTGTYINHNHFAGLLELIIPLAVAFLVLEYQSGSRLRQETRAFRGWRLAGLVGSLGILCTALVLSGSRGGMAASLASLVFLTAMLVRGQSPPLRLRRFWASVVILTVAVGILLGEAILERFSYTIRDAPQRLSLWKDSLKIVRDYPLLGTGLGTYREAIVPYRTARDYMPVAGLLQPGRWEYAHNDYLQLVVECGLLGALLLFWAAVSLLKWLWRRISGLARWEDRVLAWSLLSSLLAMLVHSVVDFNLHIPANALLFSLILGLCIVLAQASHPPEPAVQ
ncbi:MAG: O-antigen ligase family protein [Acidobacteriota bacterium]